jgi:hypothetical protein
MGQLIIVDPSVGWEEDGGIVQRISGRGAPIEPKVRDALVNGDWPMFLHPFPLSDKYFLVSCWKNPKSSWKIYLADVFDNLVLVHETPGYALLEPTPLTARPVPPVIPEQIDLASDDATVFISDVYAGPGLKGVPRGTIKRLRLVAYHFGYRGLAGSDKIGFGGPWEAMRILGTVPVKEDGSASFRVPAKTPISIQTLDAEGKAVQLMRSWFTAMPGERVSCVGCHETPKEVGHIAFSRAATRSPDKLAPWYGPARGFDFEREVQPVLDRHCVYRMALISAARNCARFTEARATIPRRSTQRQLTLLRRGWLRLSGPHNSDAEKRGYALITSRNSKQPGRRFGWPTVWQ